MSIDIATVPGGTATALVDYTPTNGTVVFLPGEVAKFFNVRVLNDTNIEGNESIGGRNGEDLLIADNVESFANGILRVLNDDAFAEKLSSQGRRFTENNLDWPKNLQPLWDFLRVK